MARHSIKFADAKFTRSAMRLMRTQGLEFTFEDGAIAYSEDDEPLVEDVLSKIRTALIPAWQILSCPREWVGVYRRYMDDHRIPFIEEIADGETRFLLARRHFPHRWKLAEPEAPSDRKSAENVLSQAV